MAIGRQGARSIHFLVLVGFVLFIITNVALVVLTGFRRNMNHIVLGVDNTKPAGVILRPHRSGPSGAVVGVVGCRPLHLLLLVVFSAWHAACVEDLIEPVRLLTLDRFSPREHYNKGSHLSLLWPNGKLPVRDDWKQLAADGFKGYRLKTLENLTLGVGRTVLQDVKLMVGDSSQQLTVSSDPPSVDLTTISFGTTIGYRTVQEIPLNGRFFLDLGQLTPGSVTASQNGSAVLPLRGAGSFAINTAGNREEKLGEKAYLQFRSEFFDLFNHPNLGQPGNVVGTPDFGRITRTRFPRGESGLSRQVQFALKLVS